MGRPTDPPPRAALRKFEGFRARRGPTDRPPLSVTRRSERQNTMLFELELPPSLRARAASGPSCSCELSAPPPPRSARDLSAPPTAPPAPSCVLEAAARRLHVAGSWPAAKPATPRPLNTRRLPHGEPKEARHAVDPTCAEIYARSPRKLRGGNRLAPTRRKPTMVDHFDQPTL